MKYIYLALLLSFILTGCATKMAYLDIHRTAEEVQKDKDACEAVVNNSDFKDPDLKRNKLNQCMKDKGYNVVSEAEAEKIQGFKGLWIKPGVDFKAYEVIFIDKVDLSQVKVSNTNIPNTKVTDEDINNLGEEMLKRFSETLSVIMPVISDKEEALGKKVLYIRLKLDSIFQTNIGFNAALQVAGEVSGLPMPGGPQGTFSFEGVIADFSGQERLITISDEVKSDKNSSLAGFEKFSRWKYAYNVMDYWADHLAALLAKVRGQEYKSRLGIKIF
jgi:hypothetical protein